MFLPPVELDLKLVYQSPGVSEAERCYWIYVWFACCCLKTDTCPGLILQLQRTWIKYAASLSKVFVLFLSKSFLKVEGQFPAMSSSCDISG